MYKSASRFLKRRTEIAARKDACPKRSSGKGRRAIAKLNWYRNKWRRIAKQIRKGRNIVGREIPGSSLGNQKLAAIGEGTEPSASTVSQAVKAPAKPIPAGAPL